VALENIVQQRVSPTVTCLKSSGENTWVEVLTEGGGHQCLGGLVSERKGKIFVTGKGKMEHTGGGFPLTLRGLTPHARYNKGKFKWEFSDRIAGFREG